MENKIIGEKHVGKLTDYTHGLDVDVLMASEELVVQKAWLGQLFSDGYLSEKNFKSVFNALDSAEKLIKDNTFNWRQSEEDIHMNIERFVLDAVGDIGLNLHLGRSRNDLVSTTQRLFVKNKISEIEDLLKKMGETLCSISEKYIDVIIPGFTHLQSGAPTTFAHMFLAHAHAIRRDLKKIQYTKNMCVESLPLGAAAFSGTHLKS